MDCKITFLNRGLYCDAHQSEGMSALCDVAEQELRRRLVETNGIVDAQTEAIVQLKKTVSILREQVTSLDSQLLERGERDGA